MPLYSECPVQHAFNAAHLLNISDCLMHHVCAKRCFAKVEWAFCGPFNQSSMIVWPGVGPTRLTWPSVRKCGGAGSWGVETEWKGIRRKLRITPAITCGPLHASIFSAGAFCSPPPSIGGRGLRFVGRGVNCVPCAQKASMLPLCENKHILWLFC